MTSSREDGDLIQGYEHGANSYVVKPVQFDEFSATVKQLGLYWLMANELPGRPTGER
jgi:two-component system response regulator